MAPAAGPVALWNAVSRARFAYRSQILKPRLINAKNNTLVGRGQFDAVGRHVVVIGRIGTCFVAHGGAVEQWGGTPSYYPAAHGAFVSKSQVLSVWFCDMTISVYRRPKNDRLLCALLLNCSRSPPCIVHSLLSRL